MSATAKTAREVFVAAVKLAPEEWDAYLKAHCGGDDELRHRVEALLKSHMEAGSFLGKPVPERLAEEMAMPASSDTTQSEAAADESSGDNLAFLAPSAKPDSLGRLGHYEILEVIGRGGMGIVLRAFDEKLHRVVAIKVMAAQLATNATARKRFSREAQAAAAVSHDHIVTIHAVDEANGIPYLVMQFIDGVSLQERLDINGPLQLHEILRIGMQTASGLAAAHAQGLIHRDIKPANILLENGVERVKITDFGLARAATEAKLTQSGVVAGTPQYMSPEQAEGKAIDQRTDLFSLGSVLYAMCTGRAPFRGGNSMSVLKRVCEETPPPIRETNPEIPDWLVAIIDKLHAKDPVQRYDSAAEVAELLGRHLAHLQHPILSPLSPLGSGAGSEGNRFRPSPLGKQGSGVRGRRRFTIAAAVLLCLIAGLSLTEATGVTKLRVAVIRIFTPKVTIEGDGAPAQVTAKVEKGAFVLLAAGKEREFDTLAETVQNASDGDTVEIRGNGPFVSQPIKITRPLNIRAAPGVRPVIQLSPEAVEARANLFETAAALTLEGLELQLEAQLLDERLDSWQSLVLARAPLFIANCRLLFKQLRGTVVENYGPSIELRNCEVICPTGNWIASYHQPHLRVNIDNCCLTTGMITHYGRYGAVDYTKESTVRSTRNTFVTQNQPFSFLVYTDKAPGLWTKDQRLTPVRLATEGNIWDTRTSVLLFGQTPSGKVLPPGEAEASLPKLLAWHGARNLYAVDGPFLGLGIIPREFPAPAKPIRSVAEWGTYWGAAEAESIEGRVRYQGGDLLSRLAVAPEKLTAEDFRLADGSPGKGAGNDGKDLGADIDLVGPGPAYERWTKTPEYQQWLKDTGQVKK